MSKKSNLFLFLKALIILGLILILLIPAMLISNLIDERESLRSEAVVEVSGKWGHDQNLVGPYLSIPYYNENGKASENCFLQVMPENLKITRSSSLPLPSWSSSLWRFCAKNVSIRYNTCWWALR